MSLSKPTQNHVPEALPPEALERLLEGRRKFLAFLEKRVGSRAVAEDLLQDAFVRGLERGGELRDEESVVAWFYRLLRNSVIDYYRKQQAGGRALESWARQAETAILPQERQEVCGCFRDFLHMLKPEYRTALEVVDLGEGTLKDLAQQAGISPGNAAVRVHRARAALREQIQQACATCAEHGCLDCQCKSADECN